MKSLRSCPICPNCGSKKFERLTNKAVQVRCISCKTIITL